MFVKNQILNIRYRSLIYQQGGIVLMSQDEIQIMRNHQIRCNLFCVESLCDVTVVLGRDEEKGFIICHLEGVE